MIISTKIRYGLRALLEIAKVNPGEGVMQKDISERQDISNKYLDHIIRDMKAANIICNQKLKKSGYKLKMPASEITVYTIYQAFEDELCLVECIENKGCKLLDSCQSVPVWRELNSRMIDFMKSITLQDIIEGKDLSLIQVR